MEDGILAEKQAEKEKSTAKDLLFGSAAGFMGKLVEFPFSMPISDNGMPKSKPFNGTWDCLAKTVRNEGFLGLYKGLASPLVGSVIENALLFQCYTMFQSLIIHYSDDLRTRNDLSLGQYCISGILSGAVVSTVLTPIELVKCKLQVQDVLPQGKRYTATSVLVDAVKTKGLSGLYVGHGGTFIRESLGGGVWFACYEGVSKLMVKHTPGAKTKHDLSPVQCAAAGAVSGMAFNASMFPADSIKSRQQTQNFNFTKTFMQTARELYRAEGIRGFYRGLGITLLRSCPSSGIMFLTFVLSPLIQRKPCPNGLIDDQ